MNFCKTVPAYDPAKPIRNARQPYLCINPQTTELCTKLGITDPCVVLGSSSRASFGGNQGDVSIGEDEDDPTYTSFMLDSSAADTNPDEISLDDDDDEDGSGAEEESKDVTQNRTRLSLSLPPVKGDEGSTSSSGLPFGDVSSPGGLKFPDPSDSSSKGELTTSTPMVPRVIKRRNLDIYTSSSQDDDTSGDGEKTNPSDSCESKEAAQELGAGRKLKIKRRNQAIYTADDDDD